MWYENHFLFESLGSLIYKYIKYEDVLEYNVLITYKSFLGKHYLLFLWIDFDILNFPRNFAMSLDFSKERYSFARDFFNDLK